MPRSPEPTAGQFRIRVSIVGTDPEIWRELAVNGDLTLAELHDVLQIAFGWRDSHLHNFTDQNPFAPRHELPRIGRNPRTWAPDDLENDDDVQAENEATLAQIFHGFAGPLYYIYDVGDGWIHEIELIEPIEHAPAAPRAIALRGERRGPLEDSGGIAGYAEKLAILADPQHPEHEEIAEWVRWVAGPWLPFDSDFLDIDAINAELGARFDGDFGMSGLPTEAFPGHLKPAEYAIGNSSTVPLLPDDAAIIDLLARLPVPLRSELRGLLRRTGALRSLEMDAQTAATMVEPFLWLLRRAGESGIRLTQAGWLPPAVVSEAMLELGWADRWFGKANREHETAPIATLRNEAVRFGLLHKRKGVLLPTAATLPYLDDPLGLWRMLADKFLRRVRSDPERDIATLIALDIATGHEPEGGAGFAYDVDGIVFGLEALGWSDANGDSLSSDVLTGPVYEMLNRLDVFGIFEFDRWHRSGVTDGGRAFARTMLRSPVL